LIDLDNYDYRLLLSLREDSRLSLRELGAKADLSAPAVAGRLKRLEQLGVIKGYTITISDSVFALEVESLFFVKVPFSKQEDFLKYTNSTLCVSSLLKIAGDYNYMLIASFKNMALLDNFYQYLEQNFGQTKVQIVLKKEFTNRAPMSIVDTKQVL
jgi:Lrp/AsnC family leucine-responsive transcriptional regulator